RRHTRSDRDWSSDVCSSDLHGAVFREGGPVRGTADRDVIASQPVDEVVAALVAGSGPVRHLVPGQARRSQAVVGELVLGGLVVRSEERRVGKEWRARGAAGV